MIKTAFCSESFHIYLPYSHNLSGIRMFVPGDIGPFSMGLGEFLAVAALDA